MWYVYVLENRDLDYLYIGSTGIFKTKLIHHNNGVSRHRCDEENLICFIYGEVIANKSYFPEDCLSPPSIPHDAPGQYV